jgi:hypothetical protein
MNNLENELKEVLSSKKELNTAKAETLRKEVVQMFDKKLKRVKLTTQISVLALVAIIIYGFYCLGHSQSTKGMFTNAIVIVILAQSTVLMKLWYWVLNAKYAVLREIKQLQLQIAEMTGKPTASDN